MAVGILKTTDSFPCVTQAYRPITLIGAYSLIWFITHRTPGQCVCLCVSTCDRNRECVYLVQFITDLLLELHII